MSDRTPRNDGWIRPERGPDDDQAWLRHDSESSAGEPDSADRPGSDGGWLRYDLSDPAQGTTDADASRATDASWLPPELEPPVSGMADPADPEYDTGLRPDLAEHPEMQSEHPADQPAYPEPTPPAEPAYPTRLTDPHPAGRHEKPLTYPEHTIFPGYTVHPEPSARNEPVPLQPAVHPQPHGRHERPRAHVEGPLHPQPADPREPTAYQARLRPQAHDLPATLQHPRATDELAAAQHPVPAEGTADRPTARTPSQAAGGLAMLSAAGKEFVIVIGMALVLSFIVKTWLLQAFYIPSGSMEDTLVLNDRVVVSKLTPGPFDVNRGDIVVFSDPGEWLSEQPKEEHGTLVTVVREGLMFVGLLPDDSENHLIKRVIGLPGDHVVCCDEGGRLTVNGTPILEPYIKEGDAASDQDFDIRVPEGSVWVMGDHRSNSSDSRFHDPGGTGVDGSVPESLIVGRAVALVWPLDHLTRLASPEATFAKVPPPVKGDGGADLQERAPSERP